MRKNSHPSFLWHALIRELEVKIKSAFVIKIVGQPWRIRPYSFPASFSPERGWGVCLESQWGKKSNASWPGSVAVNSKKRQTQARSGNIMPRNVWTEKKKCVMEQHKFHSPKGLLIDSVLHSSFSQSERNGHLTLLWKQSNRHLNGCLCDYCCTLLTAFGSRWLLYRFSVF